MVKQCLTYKRCHDVIATRLERDMESVGLSLKEFEVMNLLDKQHDGEGGHYNMQALAAAIVLSQSATTRLISRLEKRELLGRYICPTDRRGIYVDITALGEETLAQAREQLESTLTVLVEDLGDQEEYAEVVQRIFGTHILD